MDWFRWQEDAVFDGHLLSKFLQWSVTEVQYYLNSNYQKKTIFNYFMIPVVKLSQVLECADDSRTKVLIALIIQLLI